jgi:anti-sigma factor (TIGR02949 family)
MSDDRMITCNEALEQLWAYIDGELPEGEARGVKSHLEACRGCHPHFDYQKAFCQFLRRQAQTPVPASLRRRVFLALLEEDRRDADPATETRTPPEPRGPAS